MSEPRQEFSDKTKLLRWTHARGRCEYCDVKLVLKPVEYDHFKSCRDGGDNSFENCRVSCRPCHKAKTKGEQPIFATHRKREKTEAGIRKRSKWQCGKDSHLKQKIGGQVVPR